MSDYTSGSINFTGLGSGTDFAELIDGLIEIDSTNKTRLETWRAEWEAKQTKFEELNTMLLNLQTTLKGMDTMNEFLTKTASTTDSSIITATADADAVEGTHSIVVNQLAKNEIEMTASGVGSLTSSVFASNCSFSFSYGGKNITLDNISAGTTLEQFVEIINNNADCRDKVRASTIYDGQNYYLQLTGMDQGATNEIVITDTGSFVFSTSDFTETQHAQNAQIRVDGFPSNGSGRWIERDSNTVDDVIDGVTLNLKSADPTEEVQIGMTIDTASVKENIQTFVDQVNEIRSAVKELTAVDTTTNEGSILTGNYGVQIIGQSLKDICANIGVGFEYYTQSGSTVTGDLYSSLSQIGILTDAEEGSATAGLLVIDEDLLDEALDNDTDAVAKLFAADYVGVSRSSNFSYRSHIDGITEGGNYDIRVVTDATGISKAYINGNEAKVSGWEIIGKAGTPEAGLTIRLDNHTLNTTTTGEVSLQVGKAGEMVEKLNQLTSTTDGPLKILQDNYEDIMDSIDKKIEYEETRLSNKRQRLTEQFARLDALLGNYSNLSTMLSSQITQLTKDS